MEREKQKFLIELPKDLATRFRVKVTQKYGRYKGNVNAAFTEAVKKWVEGER